GPTAPGSENVAEHIAKNVAEGVARSEAATASTAPRGRFEARMTVLIVDGALLRIGEHLAGFFRFLEELLRLLVIRIAVGMMLHGEAAISLFDFRLGCRLRYVEYLVIIAFGHALIDNRNRPS